jgi:hypothetical protein
LQPSYNTSRPLGINRNAANKLPKKTRFLNGTESFFATDALLFEASKGIIDKMYDQLSYAMTGRVILLARSVELCNCFHTFIGKKDIEERRMACEASDGLQQ